MPRKTQSGGEPRLASSGQLIFQGGYAWHVPCSNLNVFPRKGKMVPSTILAGEKQVWKCEVCETEM